VVARAQLVELGVSRATVDHWLKDRRLHSLHRSVYAFGHEALGPRSRTMAAVLACGPEAVASHRTAAWLWDLMPDGRTVIDVTAQTRRRARPGIAVHTARLEDADRADVDGILVTTLSRTLLDVAEVVVPRQLERAIEAAERSRHFDLAAIEEVMRRGHGRRGLGRLRAALAAYRPPPFTRSELEQRFMELVRGAGLPLPSQNVYLHGYEVDAIWEHERLIVELDGYEHHRTRAAFERDRQRDAMLRAEGWTVLRFTWRQVVDHPETVVAALRATLTQPW
jgi:very-short-patch-repair endonuclease